jgi:hypothetical protein
MSVVNATYFRNNRRVLKWRIFKVCDPDATYRSVFYDHIVLQSSTFRAEAIPSESCSKCYVGGSKETLDNVRTYVSMSFYYCSGFNARGHEWRLGFETAAVLTSAVKCGSMADLRKIAESKPRFAAASLDSLSPVKILLTDVFRRLELYLSHLMSWPLQHRKK